MLSTAQLWSWQSWRSALSKPNKSQATPTKHYKTLQNSTAKQSKSLTWNTLKAVLAEQCCLIEFLASLLLLPEEPTKSQMSLCHIAQSANFQQLSRRHKMNVKHNPCECYSLHKNWSTKHIFLVIIDGGSKPIVSSRLDPRVETLIGNNLVSVQHPCFIGDYNKNKIGMF